MAGAATALGILLAGCPTEDRPRADPPLTGTMAIGRTNVAGQIQVGETLLADDALLGGAGAVSFQWLRVSGGVYGGAAEAIEGATGAALELGAGDEGYFIAVEAARSGFSGSRRSAALGPVVLAPGPDVPALGGTVIIDGTPAVGQTLTANVAGLSHDAPGLFSFQWRRGSAAIEGATGATHAVASSDAGLRISVNVTRTRHSGAVASAPTDAVPLDFAGEPVYTADDFGRVSRFRGSVPAFLGWAEGSIDGGYLTLSAEPPFRLQSSMGMQVMSGAQISDENARFAALWLGDGEGSSLQRGRLISAQGQTVVFDEVTFVYADRPVTVSRPAWNDSHSRGAAFSIELDRGWNPVHQRVEEIGWVRNFASTAIAHPDGMRWYWDAGGSSPGGAGGMIDPPNFYGAIWEMNLATGQASRFARNLELGGTGSGAIIAGHLSYHAGRNPYPLASEARIFPGAELSGYEDWWPNEGPQFHVLQISDGAGGSAGRMRIESFSAIGGTVSAVFEEALWVWADRSVTVSSAGWTRLGQDGALDETGSAFEIELEYGWNTILRSAEMSMGPSSFSMSITSTSAVYSRDPGLQDRHGWRWYWQPQN